MLKCTKCSEEKPESLFVQIKGKRVGMVCRVCRSDQIVKGRHNREEIEKRLSERISLASDGKARCSKCDTVKDDFQFPQKDGKRHGSVCQDCTAELKKYWHSLTDKAAETNARAEKIIAIRKAEKDAIAKRAEDRALSLLPSSVTKCRVCGAEKVNTDFPNVNGKRHGKRCSSCIVDASREFREKRLAENPDLHRATRSHESNMRRAGFAKRIPPWADKEEIALIYAGRPLGYHVDHEIPLFGKLVSGLHVANNLQYLTATENMKKNRSFTP